MQTIRVTEFVKRLIPEDEKSLYYIRKNLKKQGKSLDFYSERGTRIHKELERAFNGIPNATQEKNSLIKIFKKLFGINSLDLYDVVRDLIYSSGIENKVITERTLKSYNIIPDFLLKGTFDLLAGDELYDYKTISEARLKNKDNLKRIALQQVLYVLLIHDSMHYSIENNYIIWININEKNKYKRIIKYEIVDEKGTPLIEYIRQGFTLDKFKTFKNIWNDLKYKKLSLINKGEYVF